MNNIIENKDRVGRFTSSQVYKLVPFGKVKMSKDELIEYKKENPKSRVTTKPGGFLESGLTYIKEKQLERRMGRSIDLGGYNNSTTWGNFMELVIFNLLGLDYKIQSNETFLHNNEFLGQYWGGSVDLTVPNKKVAEIKCYELKKGGLYADCLMQKDVDLFRSEFPSEYWQIVSNAIIHDVEIGEAILYMPYYSEMDEIKELANEVEGEDKWKYRFIVEKPLSELACLPDDGYYSNITTFEFEVPQKDKDFLTSRVKDAIELLIKSPNVK